MTNIFYICRKTFENYIMSKLKTYLLLSILICGLTGSCATLSESQRESIKNLSVNIDGVTKGPSVMMEKMSSVRLDRGVFYASSLSSHEAHVQELDDIALAQSEDLRLAKKFDAGISFLNSYLYALRSLSNTNRWSDYGTELRALGRTVSSTMTELNELQWFKNEIDNEIIDITKTSFYLTASLSESVLKRRQMKILRDYVIQADTLVAACVDAMVEILKSERLKNLIKNERDGLRDNYLVLLKTLNTTNELSYSYDIRYINDIKELDDVEKLRRLSISSLQAFKRAHAKMAKEIVKRKDIKEVYEELIDYSLESLKIIKYVEERGN